MSPTTNSGNLDATPDNAEEQVTPVPPSRRVPWRIIVLGVVTLLLAVIIATQVLGVLYVIVFPPGPPLPGDLTLLRHVNSDYGVDEWLYDSRQQACDVLAFYMNSGGECRIGQSQCADTANDDPNASELVSPGQHIARCIGESKVSIFGMRWQAIIATGPHPDVPTEFRVTREIYWTGQIPPLQIPEPP